MLKMATKVYHMKQEIITAAVKMVVSHKLATKKYQSRFIDRKVLSFLRFFKAALVLTNTQPSLDKFCSCCLKSIDK